MGWLAAALIFIALLYFFPRWMGYGLVVAAILAAGAGVYWGLHEYQKNREKDKVQANLRLDKTTCRSDFPIFAGFVNGSGNVVTSIHYSINVKRKGYSGVIGSIPLLESDKILQPGEGHGLCYAMPELKPPTPEEQLIFELAYKSVYFQ